MKKIKIMLLSLALFAVVGAALAFKARFLTQYCTTNIVGSQCPAANACLLTTSTTIAATIPVCYTLAKTYTIEDGSEHIGCFRNVDPTPGNTVALTCTSTTSLKFD